MPAKPCYSPGRSEPYRYVPLGSPRVRDARERQHWARRGHGLGWAPLEEPQPEPEPQQQTEPGEGGGREGTGSEWEDADRAVEAAARSAHRAAGPRQTRRGGRKTSERGWDASRLSYEIGVVLEGVVRRVETIDAGYHGQQALDSLYWVSPFLLESLPSMPK